jgi:mannose-6-phosphate isomerase-like protein (cupin superfamily)
MHQGDAQFVNLFQTDNLHPIRISNARRLTPATGESRSARTELNDRVIYVLSGEAHLKVGTLSGPLPPHQYQHIPATTWHQIGNPGYEPLVYLSLIVTDPDTAHGTEARG